MKKNLAKAISTAILFTSIFSPVSAFASPTEVSSIDAEIQQQQKLLDNLSSKKNRAQEEAITNKLNSLESTLKELRSRKSFDAQGALDALTAQIDTLRKQLSAQSDSQTRILELIQNLEQKQAKAQTVVTAPQANAYGDYDNAGHRAYGTTNKFLINPGPGPNSGQVSYTQDAKNAQGNSTMVFRYSPNQMYKIYCRTGYLTDLAFHPGEKITFAGGGDTTGWSVSATEVDGVPHLYIKPVVQSSVTNLIVNTTHHSYQIILNTSDWYNPMVVWTYDTEDKNTNLIASQKESRIVTDSLNAGSMTDLNFNYKVSGDSDMKPAMVFDDGNKTFIQFKRIGQKMPVLFIRERGKKSLSLVNYRMKDNYYIVDKIFTQAELRVSNTEIVRITRER